MKPVMNPEQLYPTDFSHAADVDVDVEQRVADHINPDYYKGKIECIDVIEQIEANFCLGNVIKYVWRWKGKNGLEDLKKARWYLDRAIQEAKRSK